MPCVIAYEISESDVTYFVENVNKI